MALFRGLVGRPLNKQSFIHLRSDMYSDNPFIVHKYDKHPHSPDRSSSDDCELHLFEAGTDPTVGLSTGRDIRWDFRKPYGGHVVNMRLSKIL